MKRIALAIAVLAGVLFVSCKQPASSATKQEQEQEVAKTKEEMKEPVTELTSVKAFNAYKEQAAAYINILKEALTEEGLSADKVKAAFDEAEEGLTKSYNNAKQTIEKSLKDNESVLQAALGKLEAAHKAFIGQIEALKLLKK